MLSKIGRWTAGRLQGSQGVQKYDGFMARNPWAKAGLDIAGGIALGAATGGIGSALVAKGGTAAKFGKGIATAGKWAGRMGVMPGGSGYNPGAGGAGARGGISQLDQLNRTGMMELNDMRDAYKNMPNTSIANDPLDGMSFDAPGNDLIGRATDARWMEDAEFNSAIQNDALTDYRNARFDDRIANDAAANMGDRFSTMYNPGIDGTDAMGDMQSAYSGMMAAGGQNAAAGVANADLSRLDDFNADASFERYATGANNRFMSSLQSGLNSLRDNAAGGNRLNTGFFDLDSGKLGRDLRQDFSNDISAAALQTNQQNLAARTSAAGFRTDMANNNASLATQASIANQRNRLDSLVAANNAATRRAELQREDRNFKANRFDRQTNDQMSLAELQRSDRTFRAGRFDEDNRRLLNVADRQRDDRKFTYGVGQDRLTRADERTRNDRSTFLDAAATRQRGWQASNDARFRAADMRRGDRAFNEGMYQDRRNSYLDMLSGMTDRAQGVQNARDQRRANSQQSWLNLAGTAAGIGANMWMNRRGGSGGTGVGGSAAGSMMGDSMQDWVRNQKPVLTVGGR